MKKPVGIASVFQWHRVGAIFALLAAPSLGLAEPWHGAWAAYPDRCKNIDKTGETSNAPIRLTATEFLASESRCILTDLQDAGRNAWRVVYRCDSNDGSVSSWDIERLIMVDRDTLWMWFGDGGPIDFTRCEE